MFLPVGTWYSKYNILKCCFKTYIRNPETVYVYQEFVKERWERHNKLVKRLQYVTPVTKHTLKSLLLGWDLQVLSVYAKIMVIISINNCKYEKFYGLPVIKRNIIVFPFSTKSNSDKPAIFLNINIILGWLYIFLLIKFLQ